MRLIAYHFVKRLAIIYCHFVSIALNVMLSYFTHANLTFSSYSTLDNIRPLAGAHITLCFAKDVSRSPFSNAAFISAAETLPNPAEIATPARNLTILYKKRSPFTVRQYVFEHS